MLKRNLAILFLLFCCAGVLSFRMPVACAQADMIDTGNEDGEDTPTVPLTRVELLKIERGVTQILSDVVVRVRVTKTAPAADKLFIEWREGGEGLGGKSTRGTFTAPPNGDKPTDLAVNQWSTPVAVKDLIGLPRNTQFLTVTVSRVTGVRRNVVQHQPQDSATIEFEFATSGGEVLKRIEENAPQGATVTVAISPTPIVESLRQQGFLTAPQKVALRFDAKLYAGFVNELQGLREYVHARHERLLKEFSPDDPLPKHIGVVGRLGGFGTYGFGVRHSNPAIVNEEVQILRLLGMNGSRTGDGPYEKTASLDLWKSFPRLYWGGPGSGSPMAYFRRRDEVPSPYDADLRETMKSTVESTLADYQPIKVEEKWGIWSDEIGVATRPGVDNSPATLTAYREYLRAQGVSPDELGAKSWEEVAPFALWQKDDKGKLRLAPPPEQTTQKLNYYYTYRFMTYATGQLFTESAAKFDAAGIKIYAMMTPSPSWGPNLLDWHEFYDQKPNRVLVFETSNRDPRAWQWESYLGDIMRGISGRHGWPMGALIKPHRGAPKQRMLSLLARGMRGFEWYTYGPDYVKGDNFSRHYNYLKEVGEANRFAGKAEEYIYEARPARKAEVAFVYPRSSEIWEHATQKAGSKEDARWVYLALSHAHIPVDVLSEEQLAEGRLDGYKVLYIVGKNLRRDAAAKVRAWVQNGGVLWTDIGGLSLDEANEPATAMNEMLGLRTRAAESWGTVPTYGSVGLPGIKETTVPTGASLIDKRDAGKIPDGSTRAYVAREPLDITDTNNTRVLGAFNDGKPAFVRHSYGKGAVYIIGAYAGVSYSAKVRRTDYEMTKDYDETLRNWIAEAALSQNIYRPVIPAAPTVESVLLDKNGKRSIALMNWTYTQDKRLIPWKNLRIALPDAGEFKTVRSLQAGVLKMEGEGKNRSVVLPELQEVDLLILE